MRNFAMPIESIVKGTAPDNTEVYVGGIIQETKKKITGKGDEKIHFVLEDATGKVKVVASEQITKEKGGILNENEMLMVRGRLSYYDTDKYVFAQSIITLEEAYEKMGKYLHIKVREVGFDEAQSKEIYGILSAHKGTAEVLFHVLTKNSKEIIMAPGEDKRVKVSEELLTILETMLGTENVWLSWKK